MAYNTNFDPIYAALFTLLSGAAGFVTTSRQLQHWADLPSEKQPALFLPIGVETSKKQIGQPARWMIDVWCWVYAQAPDDVTAASTVMNPLLAAIRTVMETPDASGIGAAQRRRTLGGIVLDTWIEGKIITDEGLLGLQSVAKVPIHIECNG